MTNAGLGVLNRSFMTRCLLSIRGSAISAGGSSSRASLLDPHRLDDVLREIDVFLRRLRVREDDRDEAGALDIEDVQMPAVGGPLRVEARSPREREHMAAGIAGVVLVAMGVRTARHLEFQFLTGETVDLHRLRGC